MDSNLSRIQTLTDTDLATLARQYILHLYNQKNDSRLVFHTFRQTAEIVKQVHVIAEETGCTEDEWQAAAIAGWFSNAGYLVDYEKPADKSVELADNFLAGHHFPTRIRKTILQTLQSIFQKTSINTIEAQILSDAVSAVQYGPGFFDHAPLLRLERDLILDLSYENMDWNEYLVQLLLDSKFFTSYGKIHFEPAIANHLVTLKQRIEKQKRKTVPEELPEKKFSNLESRINSGAQTFFRTNYRNHINLSAIADNKANIMISVNAILISVIISVISYRNMTETNPAILMPALIFLVTGLASLIFAVLAARPKVTSIINKDSPREDASKNIVFFGNFVNLKIEKYEEMLDEMFRDTELLYGNMSRDMYYLGKVLDKKYRFLSISYNVFMVGFVATVLTFLGVLLS